MVDTDIQDQIDQINRKLDFIISEMELQRRHRAEMEDLRDDLLIAGKDLYQTAVVELEGLSDHLKTGDVIHLLKKLLRNTSNLARAFDQFESARDFLKDIGPIAREMFLDVMKKLDELDRKGYFEFAGEFMQVADRIVTSFTKEDIQKFGDNVVTILNTVKNLTQPEMLQTVNNALAVYRNLDVDVGDRVSFVAILRELNTPEMRKGLLVAIKFLKHLAEQNHQPTIGTNNAGS